MKKNPMYNYDDMSDYVTDFNRLKSANIDDDSWKKDIDTSIDTKADQELYGLYGGWVDPTWYDWVSERKKQEDNRQVGTVFNPDAKCDCGSFKTYGENYNKHLHSSWCSLKYKLR
jgi:hypothetical protein